VAAVGPDRDQSSHSQVADRTRCCGPAQDGLEAATDAGRPCDWGRIRRPGAVTDRRAETSYGPDSRAQVAQVDCSFIVAAVCDAHRGNHGEQNPGGEPE
jgi:hypothetical protein